MAQTFNSPPGWPKPPEGWTPPPGWAPDPSWPAAPDGWQFWVDDPFAAAVAAENTSPSQRTQQQDQQATQTMGTPVTQALPAQSAQPTPPGQPGLYSYAPSAGLEQPGASPYNPQQGGYAAGSAGGYAPGGGYPAGPYGPAGAVGPGGPAPKARNTTTMIVVAVVAVLVLGGLVWGISSLFRGGDEDPTAVEPSTSATSDQPTDDATSEEPTEEVTSDEPTADPTGDPTTDDGGTAAGDFVDLAAGEPALVYGISGEPVVEVRLLEHVVGWQPEGTGSTLCGEPESDQYLGLTLEFTVLPAMADEDPGTYTFIGWELGALAGDQVIETSAFATGLFCVGTEESAPSEMQPGETYTGLSVLDVPADVTAVTWQELFNWSGDASAYRWVLADQ
ncbi:hypothetical protein [Pseudactinotalea terrae]|jgi:hypothetical protein|uniref:hypothetical protein n=1 Tax=Pseudactinotalea terrae TaxID=1743262 RepID=UPI0012E1F203|nr:hypothetical protein [Pseudactinotalea terrae]